jgi:hypothetical protein
MGGSVLAYNYQAQSFSPTPVSQKACLSIAWRHAFDPILVVYAAPKRIPAGSCPYRFRPAVQTKGYADGFKAGFLVRVVCHSLIYPPKAPFPFSLFVRFKFD